MFCPLFFFAIGYASSALSMLVRSSSSNDQLMSAVAFVYEDIYGTIIYATLGRWLWEKKEAKDSDDKSD
jgi:hypothetical protein